MNTLDAVGTWTPRVRRGRSGLLIYRTTISSASHMQMSVMDALARHAGDWSAGGVFEDGNRMSKNNCNHKDNRREDWGTPRDLFDRLDDIYHFEIDLCARDDNALCGRWITPEMDFLTLPVSDNRLSTSAWKWCNPPYGKRGCGPYINKLMDLYNVVTLVPFSPGSKWFRKIWTHASYIVVIHGRLQFQGAPNKAMFDSCLAVRNGPSVLWEIPPGTENIGTIVKTQILWEGLDDTGR